MKSALSCYRGCIARGRGLRCAIMITIIKSRGVERQSAVVVRFSDREKVWCMWLVKIFAFNRGWRALIQICSANAIVAPLIPRTWHIFSTAVLKKQKRDAKEVKQLSPSICKQRYFSCISHLALIRFICVLFFFLEILFFYFYFDFEFFILKTCFC